jgi:hypothetical protein
MHRPDYRRFISGPKGSGSYSTRYEGGRNGAGEGGRKGGRRRRRVEKDVLFKN